MIGKLNESEIPVKDVMARKSILSKADHVFSANVFALRAITRIEDNRFIKYPELDPLLL